MPQDTVKQGFRASSGEVIFEFKSTLKKEAGDPLLVTSLKKTPAS
jgi:hypothetical protein